MKNQLKLFIPNKRLILILKGLRHLNTVLITCITSVVCLTKTLPLAPIGQRKSVKNLNINGQIFCVHCLLSINYLLIRLLRKCLVIGKQPTKRLDRSPKCTHRPLAILHPRTLLHAFLSGSVREYAAPEWRKLHVTVSGNLPRLPHSYHTNNTSLMGGMANFQSIGPLGRCFL